MPLISEDRWGPWAAVGGYVVRPLGTTQLRIGDNPKGHHRGGSTQAVLKSRDGLVREIWTTTGIMADDYRAGRVTEEELDAAYGYYVLGSRDLSYWMNKKGQQQPATTTFLKFNMKLNETISGWLEDGGDPARCAEALRMAADEVFVDPSVAAERHEGQMPAWED